MKVGFLGNANNFPFQLARAMRRAGHEVLFVLGQAGSLNRPERRYDDVTVAGSDWILDAGGLDSTEQYQFLPQSPLRDQVVKRLRSCDAVILNHGALSLASIVGRPHIALLTGTDIQDLANPAYARHAAGVGMVETAWLSNAIERQRSGIASAIGVSSFFRGLIPLHDQTLDELGVGDDRRFFYWATDPDYIRLAPPPRNTCVRIFNLARLTWTPANGGPITEDHKGTDITIDGIGEFCRRHPEIALDIRLVEKGLQVAEARERVSDRGFSSHVTWLKEMTQREVLDECRRADIVFDQVGLSIVGMGGLDAMAVGRPLIANARPEILRNHIPEPPIGQAANVNEVAAQLERLVLNREERERVGRESRAYVERHCSADAAAAAFVERLDAVLSSSTRYAQWSKQAMEARERLVEGRDARTTETESRLAKRERAVAQSEGRLSEVASRESGVLLRESVLARREELVAGREETAARREEAVARREAEDAELRAILVKERTDVDRNFEEYNSLRIVRWQRKLKSWIQRLGGGVD